MHLAAFADAARLGGRRSSLTSSLGTATTGITITADVEAAAWRKELCYRVTDLRLKEAVTGIQGLSVSTDRIGVTTMRCAALLSMLAARGARVNRSGSGIVTEVYPAASLARWGLTHKGYKRKKNVVQLSALVDSLLQSASWLDLGDHMQRCRDSDDAFDAVVAAITARAAALGQVEPIPDAQVQVASVEGWIALPNRGLADLVAVDHQLAPPT